MDSTFPFSTESRMKSGARSPGTKSTSRQEMFQKSGLRNIEIYMLLKCLYDYKILRDAYEDGVDSWGRHCEQDYLRFLKP
jgi:hypothetical protein